MFVVLEGKQPRHGRSLNVLQQIKGKEVVHIFNKIVLSHEKNEIMPFVATWIELGIIILNKAIQIEQNIYNVLFLICGI